jgi:hypothetical protein
VYAGVGHSGSSDPFAGARRTRHCPTGASGPGAILPPPVTARCSTPTDTTRRVMACLAAVLWVLGFEIAPNVHLGLHDHIAPHTHGGAVAHDDHEREHRHAHEHGHAHAHHSDPAQHAAADDARDVTSASRLDPAHGDHDLLHRGIAIAQPPLAQPSIAQAPVVVLARLRSLTRRPDSRALIVARARGPPVIAAT